MALGCSGTPLPERLGIGEGARVAVLHAPDGFDDQLGELPRGAAVQHGLRKSDRVDVVLGFVSERAHLERNVDWLLGTISPGGSFWLATPTGGSGIPTDLTSDGLREVAGERAWVPAAVVDLDGGWRATQLVRADRPAGP